MSISQGSFPIGLIGTGTMGSIMARHMIEAGWSVVCWDRDRAALEKLRAAGGNTVESIGGLRACPVVISVVFDDEATQEITFGPGGLIDTLPEGAIHVVMASISPALSRALLESHAKRGQHYLAASIFGRPEAAAAAALWINCSGVLSAFTTLEPIFKLLGKPRWLGEAPEKAMLVKAMGNSMITAAGQMVREMFGLLRAGGIEEPLARELLIDTLFPGPIFSGSAQRYMDDPGLPRMTPIARKDRTNCLAAAHALRVELPLIEFLAAKDLP